MSKLENYERNKQENANWRKALEAKGTDMQCEKCMHKWSSTVWIENNMRCPNCGNKYE